jgi:hypothetical protein
MEELKGETGFIKETVYKIVSWFMIIFLVGFISGIFFAQYIIIEKRLADSVALKGMVIDNKVYDLRERLP